MKDKNLNPWTLYLVLANCLFKTKWIFGISQIWWQGCVIKWTCKKKSELVTIFRDNEKHGHSTQEHPLAFTDFICFWSIWVFLFLIEYYSLCGSSELIDSSVQDHWVSLNWQTVLSRTKVSSLCYNPQFPHCLESVLSNQLLKPIGFPSLWFSTGTC